MNGALARIKQKIMAKGGSIFWFILSYIGNSRECPLCKWRGLQFLPRTHPRKHKYDSFCPRCGSAERHRLAYITLKDSLGKKSSTLHFAPERPIENWLRSISKNYVSGDIESGRAMEKVDIVKIQWPDYTFDLVWCSHILEHVKPDVEAIEELYRVTAYGGVCIVQVPIWGEQTVEDECTSTPEQRERFFFQRDHVRLYGTDIVEKLMSAGFDVRIKRTQDLDPYKISRHSLEHISTNEIFICSKYK